MAFATALDSLLPCERLGADSAGQGCGLSVGLLAGASENVNTAHELTDA